MADDLLTRPASGARGLGDRIRGMPWWAAVVLVFLASRVVTTFVLLVDAALQPGNSFSPGAPPYWRFATYWDGIWYRQIAAQGYPAALPVDAAGKAMENAWAFLPAFPGLVRGISLATTLPYEVVAIAVSALCTLGTALLFHRILVRRMPDADALWAVALFLFAPLSPILQVGYAEPMQLLLVAAVILLVLERRYLAAVPLVVLAGFTRPTGLALALFLLLHLIQRIRARVREPLPAGQLAGILVDGAAAFLAGIAWPVIAAVVTGVPDAYPRTELVWRVGYVGQGELVPFTPWFLGGDWWLRFVGVPEPAAAVLGAVIVVLLGALLAMVLLLPVVARRLEPEPRLWVASYAIYLAAVFFPQSSTFRLLMPAFPLLGAVQPTRPAVRAAILAGCVALQACWVAVCWWVAGYDWTPP